MTPPVASDITPGGSEAVPYAFKGDPDGMFPAAGPTHVDGNPCGTTAGGGDGKYCGGAGCGTTFRLTLAGVETIVRSLSPGDGGSPDGSLLRRGHLLHGMAPGFGGSGHGTVFKLNDRQSP